MNNLKSLFAKDTNTLAFVRYVLSTDVDIHFTSSGHYAISINKTTEVVCGLDKYDYVTP